MMMSPESYYDEYLKGKNAKQILTAIRSLKQEMGRLRNAMEEPDYERADVICPSASTKLWCIRMCLDSAKQALINAGGVYAPSKSEQKAELFDASIPAISKVIFSIGGFFGGYETRTITLDEDHLHFDAEHSLMPKPSNLPDGLDYPCDRGAVAFLQIVRRLFPLQLCKSKAEDALLPLGQHRLAELLLQRCNARSSFNHFIDLLKVNARNNAQECLVAILVFKRRKKVKIVDFQPIRPNAG